MVTKNEILDSDNKIEWTVGAIRRQSNLFESVLADGMMQPYFEKTLNMAIGYLYRKVVDLLDYYYMPDYLRVDSYLRNQADRDPDFFSHLVDLTYSAGKKLLELGLDIQKRDDLRNLSQLELRALFDEYIEAALSTVPMAYAAFPIEQILEEKIRKQLEIEIKQVKMQKHADDLFHTLISHSTAQSDYALVAERELIELSASIQKNQSLDYHTIADGQVSEVPEAVSQKINLYAEKHGWINTDGYLGHPWSPEEIFKRVQRWLAFDCQKRLDQMNNRHQTLRQEYEDALSELNASETLRKLIILAHQYIELRPYRPMVLIKTGHQTRNLLSQIAQRFSLDYEDIVHYTHSEISNMLKGEFSVDNEDLANRKTRRGYTIIEGRTTWYFGADVDFIEDDEDVDHDYSSVREITGQIANKGVAVGPARLLVDLLNLPDVDDGDIIVASMTMPDMLPAMERAGAYVTDEGGITCHAAIVSRELNVPCVIGTKIATSAIKDGDMLEVNANNGKVTILSRHK